MSLATAARFAARELRGGLRGFRIFLACLALGVAAIAAVGSVRAAIEAGLEREGPALLAGEAEPASTFPLSSHPNHASTPHVPPPPFARPTRPRGPPGRPPRLPSLQDPRASGWQGTQAPPGTHHRTLQNRRLGLLLTTQPTHPSPPDT